MLFCNKNILIVKTVLYYCLVVIIAIGLLCGYSVALAYINEPSSTEISHNAHFALGLTGGTLILVIPLLRKLFKKENK